MRKLFPLLSAALVFSVFCGAPKNVSAEQASRLAPEVLRFIPENAKFILQLTVTFNRGAVPSTVLAYTIQRTQYDYETVIRILEAGDSGLHISYEETDLVSTGGGGPTTVQKVRGSNGCEGVVVINTFSGAGTTTDWHVLAKRNGNFVKIDAESIRNKLLEKRGYVFLGYNGVTVKADHVFEDISGYSRGRARCCPDRPTLVLGFKFTGSAIQLESVKAMPLAAGQTVPQ